MIYVLVPAYNEAPTVGLLLWKVRQLFTSFSREYQLIVVNDGSSDATEEILAPYTRALPLTLLTHKSRKGYARSLEALLREAVKRTDRPRRDVAVTLQADFSEAPEDVLELIKKLEGGADIVVADRRGRKGASRRESFVRRILPRLVSRRLGITGAEDVVGTMRGYRLATIERLVKDAGDRPFLGHEGWAADLELLARLARHARRIESVPMGGERPASARVSRLAPLGEAWRAFRASAALKGLPMPAAGELSDAVEYAERPAAQVRGDRGDRRDHDRGDAEHGDRRHRRPKHDEQGGQHRERREKRVGARQQSDHRPKVERPRGEPRQKRHGRPAASASAAATPDAAMAEPVSPPQLRLEPVAASQPNAAPDAAEGGQRRKRRRRGRGRRGRGGQRAEQGLPNEQAQQDIRPVEPPPPDPTSAA